MQQKTIEMKKLALFASALALVAFTACNNDSAADEAKEEVEEVYEEAKDEMEDAAEEVEEGAEEVKEEVEGAVEPEAHSDHSDEAAH